MDTNRDDVITGYRNLHNEDHRNFKFHEVTNNSGDQLKVNNNTPLHSARI
jgi:hypothetical protein